MFFKDKMREQIEASELLTQKMQPVFTNLMETSRDKHFDVGQMVWMVDWSTMSACLSPYDTKLTEQLDHDGLTFYKSSYRTHFPWELFDTEEECQQVCDAFSEYGENGIDYYRYKILLEDSLHPAAVECR